MPEDPPVGTPQAGDPPAGQAPPQAKPPDTPPAQPPAQAAVRTVEDLERELKETREEAARYRVKAKQLEDAEKEAERAKLDETERLKLEAKDAKKEAQEATEKAKSRLLKASVIAEAAKLGVVDPDAAYLLLDRSKVEFDDEGEAKNIEKLLKDLVKDKAYLVGSGSSSANPARGAQATQDAPKVISGADALWGPR